MKCEKEVIEEIPPEELDNFFDNLKKITNKAVDYSLKE